MAERGVSPGFETAEELRQSNDELFEVFALVIVLLFHAIGPSFTGDVFEAGGLGERDEWSFHGHRFVAALDEHFDYKAERQANLQAIKERRAKRLKDANAKEVAGVEKSLTAMGRRELFAALVANDVNTLRLRREQVNRD